MNPRRGGLSIAIAAVALVAASVAQGADTSAFDRAALARASEATLGLPPVPVPPDNPLTVEKIALGRKLFFDRRLSHNGTISCGMCHVPEQGFTSNELATAVGIEGRTVRRNSPTVVNAAFFQALFHDGREHSLELQALAPLVAANEMGNPALGIVVDRLRRLPDYAGLFEKAFGRGPGVETIGQAIAAWQRTLIAGDSPFDQWRYGKRVDAIDAAAKRGFALFGGKAGCAGCHTIGEKHALFTDGAYHNTGVGYYNSVLRPSSAGLKVELAPGKHAILDARALASVSEPTPSDLGRYEVSLAPGDRWAYKTPTLRNIALTAPYMHDGSIANLKDVVRFYNRGGYRNELLDAAIRPLDLGPEEISDLVAFLESLTSPAMPRLVRDARSVAVGNP